MKRTLITLAIVLLLTIALILANETTIFEDGSFAVGTFPYAISGCLPWGICAQ